MLRWLSARLCNDVKKRRKYEFHRIYVFFLLIRISGFILAYFGSLYILSAIPAFISELAAAKICKQHLNRIYKSFIPHH